MDMPIGALGDGFEDRLVLESRSELARWGGCLTYLLMVPLCVGTACIMAALSLALVYVGVDLDQELSLAVFAAAFLLWLGPMLLVFLQEFRTRYFLEIALEGSAFLVNGAPVELADIKVWPHGMHFTCSNGPRFLVRSAAEEKKLQVMERLLPALVQAQRAELETTGELRLTKSWGQLWVTLVRGLTLGVVVMLIGFLASPLAGVGLGLLVLGLVVRRPLQYFCGGGMILSRTGVRRLWESPEQEVTWSEVEGCWAGAYFQNLLRLRTRKGDFNLLSARNPVVWALLIQELQTQRGLKEDCGPRRPV